MSIVLLWLYSKVNLETKTEAKCVAQCLLESLVDKKPFVSFFFWVFRDGILCPWLF